jgi:hypothetical protein
MKKGTGGPVNTPSEYRAELAGSAWPTHGISGALEDPGFPVRASSTVRGERVVDRTLITDLIPEERSETRYHAFVARGYWHSEWWNLPRRRTIHRA